MTPLEDRTRRFWCAAYYLRRGQDRDKSIAVTVLQQITKIATGTVQTRAADTLKEHDGK